MSCSLLLACFLVVYLFVFVVARLFVWVGWLGVFTFLFSLPSSWCAMHLYVYVYVQYMKLVALEKKRGAAPYHHAMATCTSLTYSSCIAAPTCHCREHHVAPAHK